MNEPMSDERLAKIRAREQAAPIGPWLYVRGFPQTLHNGSEDVPALLAEVGRLRDELDYAQDADSEATVWHDEFKQAKDRLTELEQRTRDLKRIRLAVSDPCTFTERKRFNDGDYETLPAWCARAVIVALHGAPAPATDGLGHV